MSPKKSTVCYEQELNIALNLEHKTALISKRFDYTVHYNMYK